MERIGKYRIRRLIGRGGMAEVFEAEVTDAAGLQKTVCLKRIRKEYAGHPEFLKAFESEARIVATLNHRNIVEVYDFDRIDGMLYLIMEYVDGVDLQTVLKESRGMGLNVPVSFSLHVMAGLLSALSHAHGRTVNGLPAPIIHRDVSPQNILISNEGIVKLADFGIAKAEGLSRTTAPGTIKGKLAYLSPEQAKGQPVSPASDLFSAGAVLYEMLTGTRLFTGESAAEIVAKILSFEFSRLGLFSEGVNRCLAGLLARDAAHRFKSAADARSALENIGAVGVGPGGIGRIIDEMTLRKKGSTALIHKQHEDGVVQTERNTAGRPTPLPTTAMPRSRASSRPSGTPKRGPRVRMRPAMVFLMVALAVGVLFLAVAAGRLWRQGTATPSKDELPPVSVPLAPPTTTMPPDQTAKPPAPVDRPILPLTIHENIDIQETESSAHRRVETDGHVDLRAGTAPAPEVDKPHEKPKRGQTRIDLNEKSAVVTEHAGAAPAVTGTETKEMKKAQSSDTLQEPSKAEDARSAIEKLRRWRVELETLDEQPDR